MKDVIRHPISLLIRLVIEMISAPSLALDTTFGIQSEKTLDTTEPLYHLKPN